MHRRAFFSVVRHGRLRVLDLSCERLYLRWIDARGRAHATRDDEGATLEAGEPPARIAAETEADLFEEIERRLAHADVVRITDEQWLNDDGLRRRVGANLEAFERRGGRVERESARHSPVTALVLALGLCAFGAAPALAQSARDEVLETRIEAALRASSDIPVDSISVRVEEGVVTLSGSVICADGECGGNSTPGGAGTVQQSLGAVVRAVPGVTDVRFVLRYRLLDPGI